MISFLLQQVVRGSVCAKHFRVLLHGQPSGGPLQLQAGVLTDSFPFSASQVTPPTCSSPLPHRLCFWHFRDIKRGLIPCHGRWHHQRLLFPDVFQLLFDDQGRLEVDLFTLHANGKLPTSLSKTSRMMWEVGHLHSGLKQGGSTSLVPTPQLPRSSSGYVSISRPTGGEWSWLSPGGISRPDVHNFLGGAHHWLPSAPAPSLTWSVSEVLMTSHTEFLSAVFHSLGPLVHYIAAKPTVFVGGQLVYMFICSCCMVPLAHSLTSFIALNHSVVCLGCACGSNLGQLGAVLPDTIWPVDKWRVQCTKTFLSWVFFSHHMVAGISP